MASKALATIALLLSINLLFLSMANAHNRPQCRNDALLLNVCANILNVVDVGIGKPLKPCCDLINGLVGLELDACLCIVVRGNVLGLVNVKPPLQLNLLLTKCGMKRRGYRCN
ncbi:putative lipid-binding protein AIR1B [Gossypium raimondii]|uniref:Bifunctional inhibitor/plant lipid transfer protein/seed storage helical domain-containing protein n=1 Tax=Gossypium raimondii TaxID=29730 RepID=A0A0D2W160_GOSRA|nr:putative lipid-binding protein AIR1B [Gossypium raimondii]KJB78415.1 hypothetical protein B456_013G005400 [Gossypium raimondii]